MKEIYLDYAASTPVDPEVLAAMQPYFAEIFANASSKHAAGKRAKAALEQAREAVAEVLEVAPAEIIFTGSGTASLNTAVLGAARASQKKQIYTSPIEHNAVLEPARALAAEGKRLTLFDVDSDGTVVLQPIGADTALVSVMLANNEVGTLQHIGGFARAAHAARALMHSDASQAAPTVRIKPRELGVDLLSLDGQKIYGPKGVGMLYVKNGVSLAPYYFGSAQEQGLAPGTENLAAIVGFAAALRKAQRRIEKESARLATIRDRFEALVTAQTGATVIGHSAQRVAHISAIAFEGMERDVIQAYLSQKGVYVSTGAACDPAGSGGISHVLEAMHIAPAVAAGALRVSFGAPTTTADATAAAAALCDVIKLLR